MDNCLDFLDATRAAFTESGWFHTGDRVRQDHTGWLRYVERTKGMWEVAVPDPMLGDAPVAFVFAAGRVESDGFVSDIEAVCVRMLSDFKRPRQIRLVDELPRLTLNKVDKARLRAWLMNEVEVPAG